MIILVLAMALSKNLDLNLCVSEITYHFTATGTMSVTDIFAFAFKMTEE